MKQTHIIQETKPPFAKLRPVSFDLVKLNDHFWAPRQKLLSERTLQSQYQQLEITGRISNFDRVVSDITEPFRGLYFNESDVYKWVEAAAYSLSSIPNEKIAKILSEVVQKIIAVQQPDGYLNTYFVGDKAHLRWTDLRDKHELYCAGHLIEAAIAMDRYYGNDLLMKAAIRFADLIVDTFGPFGSYPDGTPGHPEIELALVALYRHTGEKKYLVQAQQFLENRGRGYLGSGEYYQDHQPIRELKRMYGHAVRAVYLNAGAADVFSETGDDRLFFALSAMWQHMNQAQMYVTGGIGSRDEGEAFGNDYELPNEEAYAETCAAIGKIFWDWRMVQITGEAKYTDDLERTLFNAMLVGIGLDGACYHYSNPLASDSMHRRQPWFAISCCPPNIARVLATISGYLYSTSKKGIWVHLYAESSCEIELPDGEIVEILQHCAYPWEEEIQIQVNTSADFSLSLRIPGWCSEGAELFINGESWVGDLVPQSYAAIDRKWQAGDTVTIILPMPVKKIIAHPKVEHLLNKVAITSGPIVYCLESTDQEMARLKNIRLSTRPDFTFDYAGKGIGFVKQIKAQALLLENLQSPTMSSLYKSIHPAMQRNKEITISAIPYFAWGNRDYGEMQVWIESS